MTYLHVLMAVQNQNVEELEKLLSDDVKLTLVDHDDTDSVGGYNELHDRVIESFSFDCHWDFDVMNRINRGNDEIVFLDVNREEKATGKKYVAVWILTCERGKKEKFVKRFHIEVVSKED